MTTPMLRYAVLMTVLLPIFLLPPPQDDPLPDATPDPRFGTIEAYHASDAAIEAGVGWERIIFYWSEIERGGPDDWNWFHAPIWRLDESRGAGREIVGLIADTPDWATDGMPSAGVPYGLYEPLDSPTNYWARFLRYLFTVYGGHVNHWVIWNEPDIPLDAFGTQWAGSTDEYYRLVKVAYLVAHEIDPAPSIHLGGLTYWHNPAYLSEFLDVASRDPTASGHGYYFDAVSVHVYFKPETTIQIVNTLRDALVAHGLDKPIWINETNAPPYDDAIQPWQEPVFRVTQDQQAAFLLQEFALALALDVERIGVYKWADEPPPAPGFEPYGLLREDRSARPAYNAYGVITRTYAGTEQAARDERIEAWTVALDRGAGTTRVVWARGPYRTLVVLPSLSDEAQLVNQAGDSRSRRSLLGNQVLWLAPAECEVNGECLIGGPPLVLVEDAQVDLDQPETWHPRIVLDFTPRTTVAISLAGGLGIAVVAAVVWSLRRR